MKGPRRITVEGGADARVVTYRPLPGGQHWIASTPDGGRTGMTRAEVLKDMAALVLDAEGNEEDA